MRLSFRAVWVLSGLLVAMTMACAEQPPAGLPVKGAVHAGGPQSLYERLGGKPAITAVVDQFVSNVAADERINGRFAAVDIPRLKGHLVDQVCSATGGPCTYRGRNMKTTHEGMRISTNDFSALVEDLAAALDKFNVPAQEKKELLALLGPMKKEIVEGP
ncbi:MAG TPA: group 1 truncated hemoglobin [Nitrospiraceae bacterium]|nr:group 1 truncated hemoglobin [Nitrospiraceae bacterium]